MRTITVDSSSGMAAAILTLIVFALMQSNSMASSNHNKDDVSSSSSSSNYGVDASFPIHYNFIGQDSQIDRTLSVFGSDRIETYYNYLVGCIQMYSPKNQGHLCQKNEITRLNYNIMQPRSVQNHTVLGFAKVKLSDETWSMLHEYWTSIKKDHENDGLPFPDGLSEENWPQGNTYVNYWDRPTQHTSVQINQPLTEAIWQETEQHLQEWIPHARLLTRSDIYGIRIYRNGHMLAPHVDRDPLVSSAIINVDQNGMEEPWPLEVYDHEGRAHNITIEPGEMILYESHSVIHGRPFALKGNYYANIFIHFKPYFDGYEGYAKNNEGYYAEGDICIGTRPLPKDGRSVYTTMLACCKGEYAGQATGECLEEVINPKDESEGEL